MSDSREEKLIAIPIYDYGSFKVCLLQPAENNDIESKNTPHRPKIKIINYKKKGYDIR